MNSSIKKKFIFLIIGLIFFIVGVFFLVISFRSNSDIKCLALALGFTFAANLSLKITIDA